MDNLPLLQFCLHLFFIGIRFGKLYFFQLSRSSRCTNGPACDTSKMSRSVGHETKGEIGFNTMTVKIPQAYFSQEYRNPVWYGQVPVYRLEEALWNTFLVMFWCLAVVLLDSGPQ
jgi:hypothetical protein